MDESGGLLVDLIGGPLDGDTFMLTPQGSIEPPGVLCYVGVHKDRACQIVYGAGLLGDTGGWPKVDSRIQYHFWGYCELKPL